MATVSTTLPSDGQTIDAADVNTPINAILSEFNGNIDNDNIKTGANISGSKLADTSISPSKLDATLAGGWITGTLPAVSTVTANGNRSYTIAFASTVASILSEGMRLRTTRTSAATTNAFSLDGSNDYYNDTTVSGMTFTDDFSVSAWVYLTAYQQCAVVSRYNGTSGWVFRIEADGTMTILGYNAVAANFSRVQSYQSLPLNKWVHISGQLDMSTFTATTTTSYFMIDGVNVPAAVSRGGSNPTALIQAGNLEIGSTNGGTLPFAGYIDQVAIYSAKVTQATHLAAMNQGLTGSETSLISAYANGSTTDLNTTNANNLTAQNGATTVASAPWGNRGASSTLDYAMVTAISGSNATVVVPSGCTIPTSGGVSAVAYSTQANPYGFPTQDKADPIYVDGTMSANVTLTSNTTYYDCVTITIPGGMLVSGKNYVIRAVGQLQANNNGVAASGDFLARIDIDGVATGTTSSFFTSGWFGASLSPIGDRQIVATGADVSVVLKGQRSGGGATNFVSSTYTRLALEIEELTNWMTSIGV